MKPWKTLASKTVFSAPPYLDVVRETVEISDGRIIDDFYQVLLRSFVICVPILDSGDIITLRQYKHGPGRESLTFPAGHIEAGEDPADACARELLEETGYAAAKMTALGDFVDNGNQLGCHGHYFIATGCHPIQAADSGDLEEMAMEITTPARIDQALMAGEMAIIHHAAMWSMARLWAAEGRAPHLKE